MFIAFIIATVKKIFILFFAATLALAACQTKTPIKVGIMGCYIMDNNEKEVTPDKNLLKLYNEELRVANTQSYINKLTINKTEKKYFGFVLADLPDAIITKTKADSSINVIEEKSIKATETTFTFFKVKKTSGLLLVKVLFKQPNLTNSIMVDVVFDTEKPWESFYTNADAFVKKFECKKDDKED